MPHKEDASFLVYVAVILLAMKKVVGSTAYWQHKGAHALLGCAVGAAKAGDCQSGAFGGVSRRNCSRRISQYKFRK